MLKRQEVTVIADCCGLSAKGVIELYLPAFEKTAGDDVLNAAKVGTRLFKDLMKEADHDRVILRLDGTRQLLIPICEHTKIYDANGEEIIL